MSIVISRTNQLEAESFDDYMINMIVDTVTSSFDANDILRKYNVELKMIIKIIYYIYKLLKDKVTEGHKMYNIQMDFKTNNPKLKNFKIFAYVILKFILPTFITKLDDYITHKISESGGMGTQNNSSLKIFYNIIRIIDIGLKMGEWVNLLLFFMTNKFPSIWHRLLNIQYTWIDNTINQRIEFNILIKKIVWGQLSKIILFFFNYSLGRNALESIFSNLLSMLSEEESSSEDASTKFTDNHHNHNNLNPKCGICKDIFTLKTTLDRCSHSFCYYCITKHKQTVSELCPICFQK